MPHIITLSADMGRAFAIGDVARGNETLAMLLAMQDRQTSGEKGHRGNFAFYPEHAEPTDLNALSFCGPYLGYIAHEHRERLTPENRRRLMDEALPECLVGYDNHLLHKSGAQVGAPSPRWWQCNIWFLNLAGRVAIATALGREEHVEIARAHLAEARRYVELYGIAEFNSPTYAVPQLEAMHWAWRYAPDAAFRADAEALLGELYLDLAEHYHPASGVLAGTWARHYESDIDGRGAVAPFIEAAFERSRPGFLEALGLEDYRCPDSIRDIALASEPYSVWCRGILDVQRMMYQTPEFSLATQSGSFIWKQQDTPVRITYASSGDRRTAHVRSPYWCADVHAASDYAEPFERWAHQHENRAILSYAHTDGGNDLLFDLARLDELEPELADGAGQPLSAPPCPLLPAPLKRAGRPQSPHFASSSADLSYEDPRQRSTPGLTVRGAVLVGLPECFIGVLPAAGLQLHVAVMRGCLQVVIPVRPKALFALVVVGRSTYPTLESFAAAMRGVTLDEAPMPHLPNVARLRGLGPTLTAGRDSAGRLFDRRVDDLRPVCREFWCHSPFYQRRSGDRLSLRPLVLPRAVATEGAVPA